MSGFSLIVKGLLDAGLFLARGGDFVSTGASYAAASLVTIPHGLGVRPSRVEVRMLCAITEAGIPVDSVIDIHTCNVASSVYGASWWADATNIYVRVAMNGLCIIGAGYAIVAATPTNWQLVARAWK